MILFRNVSLSRGKSTTRFGVSPFFSKEKVTIFIGRETETDFLPTKINEQKIAKVSRSNTNYSFRIFFTIQQQSVAMALSAAAHHSFDKVAAGVTHDGLQAQKTDRGRGGCSSRGRGVLRVF